MESAYLKDLISGKQATNDTMDKFIKSQKIDVFANGIHQSVDVRIPSVQEIENMSFKRAK